MSAFEGFSGWMTVGLVSGVGGCTIVVIGFSIMECAVLVSGELERSEVSLERVSCGIVGSTCEEP